MIRIPSSVFRIPSLVIGAVCLLLLSSLCAEEVVIVYTGQTHAMLYPCNCPKKPDGGVARRASLIRKIRASYPDLLLLDSGSFSAGGLLDEYTQNTQLDRRRTEINLQAMELMGYDGVLIGDDEFNFGREFLEKEIAESGLRFLSCNIKLDKIAPYFIKEVSGVKIGVLGVTGLSTRQKAAGLQIEQPKAAIEQAVSELKKKGAEIILLLSHLGEEEDLGVIGEVEGIDIVIVGRNPIEKDSVTKAGRTLILRPGWQARSLNKLVLNIKDKAIDGYNTEELSLSEEVSDDSKIISVLPECFADYNCRDSTGTAGVCEQAASSDARCVFKQAGKVGLTVITDKKCITCNTEQIIALLKKRLPGLRPSYVYYPGRKAKKLIKDFGIKGLPAYILNKEIEQDGAFKGLKKSLEEKDGYYILKPEAAGISYFPGRKRAEGKLDLFISLFDKKTAEALRVLREFKPEVHFLVTKTENGFDAAAGKTEVEETRRAACVQKYHPEHFWDYIICRAGNTDSSWWEDCAVNLNSDKIKHCAKTEEGALALEGNIGLTKELGIMFGPVYLLNNQEIFSSSSVPKKEELEKIAGKIKTEEVK